MAKITTITNPLTGQPAQVDQLDHTAQEIDDAIARALPGGAIDITLQNKAVRNKRLTKSDDLNSVLESGFYWWGDEKPQNAPTQGNAYSTMNVSKAYENCCVQEIRTYLPSGSYWNDGGTKISRQIYNGTIFGEWEWENPPMLLGVEYRTTERYLGKPVYVKVVDFGAGANKAEKSVEHGASNAIVIDYGGYAKRGNGELSVPWKTNSTLSASDTVIVMTSDANYSGYNVYVWIKYYKTTD